MTKRPDIKIYLNSIQYCGIAHNQLTTWRGMADIALNELSHGEMFEELSLMCCLQGVCVYTPLRGDIEGWEHYNIPDGNFFGSRRSLSSYLEGYKTGFPVHFPNRFAARVQAFSLYLRLKHALHGQYGNNSISDFMRKFPRN
jgi:hypothetical protein